MMRGDGWVRVPVFARGIVPIGIGSAKITETGDIEITIANGETFGKVWYDWALYGQLDGIMVEPRLIPAVDANAIEK